MNGGSSYDTAQFAVDSINQWWHLMGKAKYNQADKLIITADGGGSNGCRIKLWKRCLQEFANAENLEITVCHFPPGTSKWNGIEHRLFSQISCNWKGVPLVDIETIVRLIGATTTREGLAVMGRKEEKEYEKGIKVPDEELDSINMEKHLFHGDGAIQLNQTCRVYFVANPYLRYLDKNERKKGEESPIGLILCSEGDTEHIEYLMLEESNIKVAQYYTQLPDKKLLSEKLHLAIAIAKEKYAETIQSREINN